MTNANKDIFDMEDVQTETPATETPENDAANETIDLAKERLGKLRKGEEKLVEEDFTVDGKLAERDFLKYQNAINQTIKNAKNVFDDDDFVASQLKTFLRALHKSDSPFAVYLPSTRKTAVRKPGKPKQSGIKELDTYNQLCKKVDEAFNKWLSENPENTELNQFLVDLGLNENSTVEYGGETIKVYDKYQGLAPYWRYNGVVKNWLTEQFGEEKSEG